MLTAAPPHESLSFFCWQQQHRNFSTKPKEKKKKKKSAPRASSSSGTAGRIATLEVGRKTSKSIKLCSGCGSEIRSGGSTTGMVAGKDAVVLDESKTAKKKARYLDPTDKGQNSGILCQRCRALKGDNIWRAYDALRDVSPEVFNDQLKHIVARRRFGLCILVVDATDIEHSSISNLRQTVGSTPVIVVVNKIDLLPAFGSIEYRHVRNTMQKRSKFQIVDLHAVSAVTGRGLVDLAQSLLSRLQGRDVFVVGCANVGKSSLVKKLSVMIADSVYIKGFSKHVRKRREAMHNLAVTNSNLPGTTLQAVRVPCFSSKSHALWDTPGIINRRALQYHLFPAHLMEPLTQARAIPVPTQENGRSFNLRVGQSLLIQAPWMFHDDTDDDDKEAQDDDSQSGVLARIDLTTAEQRSVLAQAYLHPSLSIRVVPTSEAPTTATIPSRHIQYVKERIASATGNRETGLSDSYSLPLKSFIVKSLPNGEIMTSEKEYNPQWDFYHMDVCLASLGWIAFMNSSTPFGVVPHVVEGSLFSKRRRFYPTRLKEEYLMPQDEVYDTEELDEDTRREIREAAKEGRHQNSSRRYNNEPDEMWYDDHDDWY